MKKVLIAIAGIVVLIVGAILIVPSFIDWSGYRTQIAQQVKDFTGRDLLIGGDIAFSVLPSPVLKVSDIRLANAPDASTSNMVSIRQLDVNVALFPLLVGSVHVNSIRLIEPVIRLEMLANGQGNWVLASKEDKEKNIETKPRAGEPLFENNASEDNAALPLQIDDFIIERGTLVYEDPSNTTYEEVNDINSRFSLAGLKGPFEAVGTVNLRGIPVGFEANVGQIVNGRTASFASEIHFAHGEASARFSGTFVNLTEGPAIKGKLTASGKSLAGLISAFAKQDTLPGGLNQPFTVEGDTAYGAEGMSFGEEGLSLTLGRDRGNVKLKYTQKGQKTLQASATFNKLDGDVWLTAAPYTPTAPNPLPLVISPTETLLPSGGERASVALAVDDSAKKVKQDTPASTTSAKLPKDIAASVSLSVDAITFKGESIRQVQSIVSLNEGEVSLERLSAILPGAGEFSLVGIAGERDGKMQFDGSMDLNFSHLRGALSWLGVDLSKVPNDRLQHLSVASQVTANPETVRIYDLLAKMDGSSLKGATTIALRSRPSFGASLSLDRFNADAYLVETQTTPSSSGQKMPANDDATNETAHSSTNAASVLDGLKILNSFDANLDLSAGHLVLQKQDIKNAEFKASIYNGDVKIQKASVGNFAGLKLGASGALINKDNALTAQDLKVSVRGENLADAAKILGQDKVMDWRKLGAVSLSATLNNNLLAPDLDLSANLLGATLIVAGNADLFPIPKADATVNAQISDLARLTRGLGLSYQPSGNPGAVEVNTDVSYTPQLVSFKNISGKIGNTALSGEALFKPMTRPYAELTLETGALRLDPFLPREGEVAAANDNRIASTGGRGAAKAKRPSVSGKWSQEVIDLSGLRGIDAKVRLKSAALSHKKITAKNVVLSADLKNGVLDVSQADAGVFGGQVNVTSKLDASKIAQLTADVRAEGLQVSQILTQTDSASSAVGRVDLTSNMSAQGQSQAQLISNLDGTANMTMQGLTMQSKGKGSSVLDILNFLAVLSGTNSNKAQADVSVASDIVKGVANLKTANLTSNIAMGSATGNVDLPQWTVDVSGNLNIQQNALVGLLAQKAKMKKNYPFSVIGSLDAPNVKLDTGGISSGGGLVIPLPDKLEKKGYGNLIRGLLGAGGVKTEAPTSEETTPAPNAPQDGTMAPPPPPPGGSTSNTAPQKAPSVEEQLLKGLGNLLKR
ncbi:MAG: AsmA family protein [Methylocystaceae bacterium]|nr:AsmA family protein [Methylocystaceae bacterium]